MTTTITADKVNELVRETAEELIDIARTAAASKQIGIPIYRSTEQELIGVLMPLVTEYLDEAQTDGSLYRDWEWSYMRDVVTPALKAVLFKKDEVRYAGFGPKSVTMRLQKSPHTPQFGKLLRDLDPRVAALEAERAAMHAELRQS
jgi:hypothetical protein